MTVHGDGVREPLGRFRAAIGAWGAGIEVIGRLSGARNEVWAVRVGGTRYAARLSRRETASLDWELTLLRHLHAAGLRVPLPVAAPDGRVAVDGPVLFTWLDGAPPSSPGDWALVADWLQALHGVTASWPQRPGFRSVVDLLHEERSGDTQLADMPAEVVRELREAWVAVCDEPLAVVHGDVGAGNVRMQNGVVGLLDWDEARRDVDLLDRVALPTMPGVPGIGARHEVARRAALACEVAGAWVVEPAYARECLRRFRDEG